MWTSICFWSATGAYGMHAPNKPRNLEILTGAIGWHLSHRLNLRSAFPSLLLALAGIDLGFNQVFKL
jgi:hypothetical protein